MASRVTWRRRAWLKPFRTGSRSKPPSLRSGEGAGGAFSAPSQKTLRIDVDLEPHIAARGLH